MTAVENGSESTSRGKWTHHDVMHDIVNDLTRFVRVHLVVYWIDCFVITIVLISIEICNTAAMSTIVEEEPVGRIKVLGT